MISNVARMWWGLVLLAAACLFASSYQRYRLREAFEPIRSAAADEEDFAVRATRHVNERHRRFAKSPRFGVDDPDSFTYRFPLYLLDGGGGCSQRSTLLVAVLEEFDIPARKLLIGLTDQWAGHVVVEVFLRGKWRVMDPLFGYVYRTDSGDLATADDLQRNPDLVARVARADVDPFPIPYRMDAFNYRSQTRFNWFRLRATLALRNYFGPSADLWAPPTWWNHPLRVAGFLLFALATLLGTLRFRRRLAQSRAKESLARATAQR